VKLPEQAKVFVVVPEPERGPIPRIRSPRLVHPDLSGEFTKQIVESAS